MAVVFAELDVYSSGYPNYFTYGVCVESIKHHQGDTFTLLNNNIWVQCSTNIQPAELKEMFFLERNSFNVQY